MAKPKSDPEPVSHLHAVVPRELHVALKIEAAKKRRPLAQIVNEALTAHIARSAA